jgi:hypothetical protein
VRGRGSAWKARSSLAAIGTALSLAACSADAVEPPEPDVDTPGAFVGVEDENLGLVIVRVRGKTGLGMGDPILIVDVLQAEPRSFEEARALVRGPDLPVRSPNYLITLLTVLTHPHEVLWFRSLDP